MKGYIILKILATLVLFETRKRADGNYNGTAKQTSS